MLFEDGIPLESGGKDLDGSPRAAEGGPGAYIEGWGCIAVAVPGRAASR